MRRTRTAFAAATLALAALAAGCTLKDQEPPPLTGPSEFATSISVSVTPDVLTQDGASQSLVTITARDANGAPARNVTLRVETAVNGQFVDFGTLSARNVVTGPDGRATVTYTAPPGVPGGGEALVTIAVTPVGSDFNSAVARTATVRLVPPGIIIPPGSLTPAFTVSPASPTEDQEVLFDASTSRSNTGIATYTWNFGDGRTATGRTVTHSFANPGNYAVSLTITDPFGRSESVTRSVTVGQGTPPTASFTVSPRDPRAGQPVNFNASASTAAAGRRIVSYRWDFGDGTFETNAHPTASHSYALPRTYTVVLTVTDDTGRTATSSNTVQVQ